MIFILFFVLLPIITSPIYIPCTVVKLGDPATRFFSYANERGTFICGHRIKDGFYTGVQMKTDNVTKPLWSFNLSTAYGRYVVWFNNY